MRDGAAHLVLRALWNLRHLALFMIGPVTGLALVAATFGLPRGLQRLAAVMIVFSFALLGLLVRGEVARLSRSPPP